VKNRNPNTGIRGAEAEKMNTIVKTIIENAK